MKKGEKITKLYIKDCYYWVIISIVKFVSVFSHCDIITASTTASYFFIAKCKNAYEKY